MQYRNFTRQFNMPKCHIVEQLYGFQSHYIIVQSMVNALVGTHKTYYQNMCIKETNKCILIAMVQMEKIIKFLHQQSCASSKRRDRQVSINMHL
jgi:hypothetical protein